MVAPCDLVVCLIFTRLWTLSNHVFFFRKSFKTLPCGIAGTSTGDIVCVLLALLAWRLAMDFFNVPADNPGGGNRGNAVWLSRPDHRLARAGRQGGLSRARRRHLDIYRCSGATGHADIDPAVKPGDPSNHPRQLPDAHPLVGASLPAAPEFRLLPG